MCYMKVFPHETSVGFTPLWMMSHVGLPLVCAVHTSRSSGETEPVAYKRFLLRNWPLERSHSLQSAGWRPRGVSGNQEGQPCRPQGKIRRPTPSLGQEQTDRLPPAPFVIFDSEQIWNDDCCLGQHTLLSSVYIQKPLEDTPIYMPIYAYQVSGYL